ncbi:Asp-tRNA(Asn)/Glu-tRNA(Gln) amidotransferase subunit GatB [Treponema sp.]
MYQSFIGLEVHIHLLTKTKIFCSCRAAYGDEPNTNICPVCMGYPGVLPALNKEALRMAALVSRALNCTIAEKTWFDRKQYFYPDMPKNYQITQFASPIGTKGFMEIESRGGLKKIRIKECHLEEDAGKMIHAGNVSLIDYNRAGISLLEIVTEPDFEVGEEAEIFLQQLRRTLRYLEVCDGNMEEGSMRADANVSINLRGAGLGNKVEIKNLNSSRFVRLGLDYEIERQRALVEKGETIVQETRLWNENRDQTESMRSKENSHDYRYFPEPDLLPFYPDAEFHRAVEAALVELPFAREKRLGTEYSLSTVQAALICDEKDLADYYEETVKAAINEGLSKAEASEKVFAWLSSDVKRIMNRDGMSSSDLASSKLRSQRLASLVALVSFGRLSGKNAKQCLELILVEDKDPLFIVCEHSWEQICNPERISKVVDSVFTSEAAVVESLRAYRAKGDESRVKALTAFLTGKVLAATDGRAEPSIARLQVESRIGSLGV